MIYIIRHGETKLNKANVLQGRSNYPLNDDGKKQAEVAAEILKRINFSYVFSSPLVRAVQTAEIIVPHTKIIVDDRLIEMDYGQYEGATLQNMPEELSIFFNDFIHNPAPEGMEPLQDVVKRAGEFIEEISALEGNILISTHAIAMKGILEYLTPDSNGSYWAKYIGNCAVYMAENKGRHIGIPISMPAQV
ncbi:MAG: histidine phosphatase family protein [Firmicutes bacterium]|nr:histidine phosphatase family protein [Bacillota bacterium]